MAYNITPLPSLPLVTPPPATWSGVSSGTISFNPNTFTIGTSAAVPTLTISSTGTGTGFGVTNPSTYLNVYASGIMPSGIWVGLEPQYFITKECFEAHIIARQGKVLAMYDKLESNARTIIPLRRVLDLIYKFASASPFITIDLTKPPVVTPLIEFHDEEFQVVFEEPKSEEEEAESLSLTEKDIFYYHYKKAQDINYEHV